MKKNELENQKLKFTDINGLTIELKQCGVRDIKITSNTDIDCDSLFNEFYKLNQLLMLFDGKLIPIDSILFFDENEENLNYSISINYYESRDVFHGDNKLCEFEKVINNLILPFSGKRRRCIGRWKESIFSVNMRKSTGKDKIVAYKAGNASRTAKEPSKDCFPCSALNLF